MPETKPVWSKKWPTEEGFYWFYGYPYGQNQLDDPEWMFVKVRTIGNSSFIYIANGQFLYKSEGAVGFFTPVKLPVLPSLEE